MARNDDKPHSLQNMAVHVCEPLLDKMPLEIKTMIVEYVSSICFYFYEKKKLTFNNVFKPI